MTRTAVNPLRVAGRVALIAAAVITLAASGGGMSMPGAPTEWPAWAMTQDPITVLFAGVRLVALVSGAYVLAVTAAGAVLMVIRPAALHSFVQRVTVPAARGLVQSLLGLTVAAVTSFPPAAAAEPDDPYAMTAVHVNGAVASQPPPPGAPATPRPPSVKARHPALIDHRRPAPVGRTPPRWHVRAGDHFWSIAQHHLQAQEGRTPTDAATARYWRRLIEHNRDRLVDPANPDLLFVGQVLELPPIGPKV